MIQYLVELIDRIEKPKESGPTLLPDNRMQDKLVEELAREIERLDPRDFAPAVQCEFVVLRAEIKTWSRDYTMRMVGRGPFRQLAKVLQSYGGPNSWIKSRTFGYVADNEIRKIIERDYRELSLAVFGGGAWKSTVILAGSILEALLYDALTRDPATAAKANAARRAPKFKGKAQPIEGGDWRLTDLIDVACELHILPEERARTVDQVLRDYRNFVHPQKEIRAQHACTEAEALLAKGALEGVCNHFDKLHSADRNMSGNSNAKSKPNQEGAETKRPNRISQRNPT